MGLTCAMVITGKGASHWWKSLSPHYPHRHTRSRTRQHAHAVGHGGRAAGVYSEDVTTRQNCHSQFTHLPTDNPIQSHTEPHMTRAYVHMHGQICNKKQSLYVPNRNIYCANKLCVLPKHITFSRYKVKLPPKEMLHVKYIGLKSRMCVCC